MSEGANPRSSGKLEKTLIMVEKWWKNGGKMGEALVRR